jgi:pimeloyl-ACP methyl ester carboxylesterase
VGPRVVALALVTLVTASALALVASPATAKRRPPKTAPPTTTTTTWPPLPAIPSTLQWTDCGGGFQCATLSVPVDWTVPAGDQVPLALARRPAAGPDPRVGALVVNYGGPGESGIDYLRATWDRMPAAVRDRFDIVTWDPRGTGASRPVNCVDNATLDQSTTLPAVPDTADKLAAVRAFGDALAQGCAQQMGAYAGELGTRNTARDLEAIRRALGEPTLNYLGYSYGTVVGATYAQMFPQSIRSMVLDGPPDWWASRLDYGFAQAQGFQSALNAFLDWCTNDSSCALRQAGAPHDVFNNLVTGVNDNPLPATYRTNDGAVRDGTLSGTLLETGVLALLYDEARGWPLLGQALLNAKQGWGGPLLSYADQYLGRAPDGAWSPLDQANAVIFCDDRPDPKPPTPDQELADVLRFQFELPPWGGGWAVDSCRGMPPPAKDDRLGDVQVLHAPPVLVIGTSGDPATPYPGAQAMNARVRGSTLLTYDSTEHTAYGSGRSTCIDTTVDAYLVDGTMPAPGTHCQPN